MSGIMSMLLGAVSSAAAAVDEFFNRVTLLLPGNGTNGAQNNTFLDSSSNSFAITRNGNTTQGTFTPFSLAAGQWSAYFDGSGDSFSVSTSTVLDLNGAIDFTIEAWVYLTGYGSTSDMSLNIANKFTGAGGLGYTYGIFGGGANQGKIQFYGAAGSVSIISTNVIPLNSWNHVAIVKNGTTYTHYLNGVANGSQTTATTLTASANALVIGDYGYSDDFLGYMSNLRITKNGAVYTSGFTPPTSPLTTSVSTGTVSLLTFQSNRFIDNSSNGFTLTPSGTPSVQAFSPFAPQYQYTPTVTGGSGYFDGTGDYLSVASATPLTFGTGDFTVEGWFYANALGGQPAILNNGSDAAGLVITLVSSKIYAYFVGAGNVFGSSGATIVTNTWYHFAWVRSGSTNTFYLNGAVYGATYSSAGNHASTGGVGIGYSVAGTAFAAWNGYIAGVRMVKGTAVYTTAFTPPTAPLTAITNTSLLTNFTNAGITDATAKNDLETVGNAQISTTQSKFGGSSMYFDGTGDWLVARYNPNLELGSGDFTVEAWVYFSTLPSNAAAAIISYGDSDNTPRWLLYYDSRTGSANGLRFTVIDGSGTAIILVEGGGTSGWAANTWYHVAVTRSGNSWRLFRDGTQTGSTLTDTDAIPAASNNGLVIGAEPNGGIPLTGYIDDLRVTKGYARYTANFTAPTAAFPVQ